MNKIILLIDDDLDEFDFYNDALKEINFRGDLIHARSADQGLTILSHITPDYIFVDFNMPKMNGLECMKEIKKMRSLRNVPIILSSTCITEEITNKAMELGASFCIRKSAKVKSLAEIMKQIFSMHHRFSDLLSLIKPN